jgi:hypothetical protein
VCTDLIRLREHLSSALSAAEELRTVLQRIAELEAELNSGRGTRTVVTEAVDRARDRERDLERMTGTTLWYALRGRLGAEREHLAAVLREALDEQRRQDTWITARADRLARLRTRAGELRIQAVSLPRLLDETADCLHLLGGPVSDELRAAEAGLAPVSRREADLDRAIRWVNWADRQIDQSMGQLGNGRTFTEYDGYFDGAGGSAVEEASVRIRAARDALGGVRDVLDTLTDALAELGVQAEDLEPDGLPGDVVDWFSGMSDPRDPVAEQILRTLADCEKIPGALNDLRERLRRDHQATVRVVQERRAQWRSILRGE